jgi:predicted Holliday junction resolvase-like endonuclease
MAGNATLAGTIGIALASNAGMYALIQSVMRFVERRRERREEAGKQEEARVRAQEAETNRLWFSESRENYATVKREAAQAKNDCAKCIDELRSTREVIYRLLEDLEDQIIPMLMFDNAEPKDVRVAMRAAVRRARDAL